MASSCHTSNEATLRRGKRSTASPVTETPLNVKTQKRRRSSALMADYIVSLALGFILILAVHVESNGFGGAEVPGVFGESVTLQFMFNISLRNDSHIGIYRDNQKIAERSGKKHLEGVRLSDEKHFVFYEIINLRLDHSGIYGASLFLDKGQLQHSSKVHLVVRQDGNSTAPPLQTNNTNNYQPAGSFTLPSALAVSSVVLVAIAVLPWLIWYFVRAKEKQQRASSSTTPETAEAPGDVPAPSLIYSVLDFPKRNELFKKKPSDQEYMSVYYLPGGNQCLGPCYLK